MPSNRVLRLLLESLKRVAVVVILSLVGFYIVFYFLQGRLLFASEKVLEKTPADCGWTYEDVVLDMGWGHTTHGWYVPVDNPRGLILFSHGNDGNMSTRMGTLNFFRDLGFSALTYDYGGFGRSTGRTSERRVCADAMAMWECAIGPLGFSPDHIVLWGRSFGGGATCDLASRVTPGAIIVESTFTSYPDAMRDKAPWLPADLLIHHRFDNKRKEPKFTAPVLITHSLDDTLYPIHHGRTLFELAPEPKKFVELRGDHYEIGTISGKVWKGAAQAFLHEILPAGQGAS